MIVISRSASARLQPARLQDLRKTGAHRTLARGGISPLVLRVAFKVRIPNKVCIPPALHFAGVQDSTHVPSVTSKTFISNVKSRLSDSALHSTILSFFDSGSEMKGRCDGQGMNTFVPSLFLRATAAASR